MNHLLNICNINGAEVEPVDVIIGGSPCQDLSVAGKRAGLDGERSGLFMEQIRIIKEMRDATNGTCPRYMVWENVPGAFSSNKGEDFCIVLEETAKIADETAIIPRPDKGKWTNSGAIMGNGWSIAWRVFDAQFWGVPQRRRRIALVADFGGQSAPEILFEREGGNGNLAESGETREGVAGDAERSTDAAVGFDGYNAQVTGDKSATLGVNCGMTTGRNGVVEKGVGKAIGLTNRGYCGGDTAETLRAQSHGAIPMVAEPVTYPGVGITSKQNASKGTPGVCHTLNQDERNYVVPTTYFLQGNGIDRADTAGCNGKGWREDVCYTLNTIDRPAVMAFTQNQREEVRDLGDKAGALSSECGMHQQNYVCDARGNGDSSIAPTMTDDHQNRATDYTSIVTYAYQRTDELKESQVSSTQSARQYKSPTDLVAAVDCRNGTENPDINGTLQAKPNGGTSYNLQNTVRTHQSVRRLTPLECERLQGFPDNWTNIPPQTEVTAEDLIFWRTVWNEWQEMNGAKPKTDKQIIKWLKSEAADSARYKALGNSIALPPWRFVLSRIHNQGARTMASLFDGIGGFPKIWQELGGQTLWCSEVEPFPIAVTKSRFGRQEDA